MKFFFTLLVFGGAFFALPVLSSDNTPRVFAQVEGETCGSQNLGNYCCGAPACVCNDVLYLKWHWDPFTGWQCDPDYSSRSTVYHDPSWMPWCCPPVPTCDFYRSFPQNCCGDGIRELVEEYRWSDGSGTCNWVTNCNQPDASCAYRTCNYNRSYNQCCATGKSQNVDEYTWSDGSGVCSTNAGACDITDRSCGDSCNVVRTFNQCCDAGLSQSVSEKKWASDGANCGWDVGPCNQLDASCPGGRTCDLYSTTNRCCDVGLSQSVSEYRWSDGSGVCNYTFGACNQPDGSCSGPPPSTPTPTPPAGGGNTSLYIDPNPSTQGQALTVIATGTTSCSTYIYDPPQSGGGFSGCSVTGGYTCSGGNPKDAKPCWWRWGCTAGSSGSYTARYSAAYNSNLADYSTCLSTRNYQVNPPPVTCTVSLSGPPPFYIGQTGQIRADVTMSDGSNPDGSKVSQVDFTGYSGIISLSQDPKLPPPPYNTVATGLTAGTTNVGATVTLNNGNTCAASSVPVTVNAPTCTVTLTPNPLSIIQGQTIIDGLGASVLSINPIGTPVDRVAFSSAAPSVATVTTPDTSAAYTSTVTGVSVNTTTVTATAYLRDPYGALWACPSASATVNVVPPPDWVQVAGGDAHIQGRLTNVTPLSNYFSLVDGTYPQPGIISANGSTAFTPGLVSSLGWLLSDDTTGDYSHDDYPATRYDYDYFIQRVQSFDPWTPADPNRPTKNELSGLGNGFYYVSGDTYLPTSDNWSITGAGKKRIVIFIDGNLTILNRIQISSGNQSFIAFIVKKNIIIDPNVYTSLNQTALDGVYIANGQIQTGSTNNPLRARGIFIAYGDDVTSAFDLQRVSPDSSTIPAEAFLYDVNLIMETFEDFKLTPFIWQEVAP